MRIKYRTLIRSSLKSFPLLFATYILISTIAVSSIYSQDCYSPSPSFADGKSPFDKIIVRDLTESEQGTLEKQFKALSGKWHGEATDEECKGGTDNPSKERIKYSINAKVETDHFGNLRLNTKLFSKTDNTTHYENIDLYLVDKKLRLDNSSGAGDVELIEVSNEKIRILKRFRAGSLNREHILSLAIGNNSFTVETRIYIQGNFSILQIRDFKR